MLSPGVSFLVPVKNGAATLTATLNSIWAQADGRPMEIIVVDDRSTDGSVALVAALSNSLPITLLRGAGRGAAAALNQGLQAARFPLICQVDQDVVLADGWMTPLLRVLEDSGVAAVQGRYVTDARASLFARIMGRDLDERYAALSTDTDHVCTGNTVYRAEALQRVGGFDERLGYGYDNDLSYRLTAAGYRLAFCAEARSFHRWRDGVWGYCRQQYGYGYGRLDLVAKHPSRLLGDAVSPGPMMMHPLILLVALALAFAGFLAPEAIGAIGHRAGAALVGALLVDRIVAGVRCARRFRDWTPLAFPFAHLLRDAAWVSAIVIWALRRAGGERSVPAHSMHARREPSRAIRRVPSAGLRADHETGARTLVVIPAYNEAANLPAVVCEIRARHPRLAIAVVDDGSTDGTREVMARLNVRRLHLPYRMGVGAAVRVGLRYALRNDFAVVVRLDGDGQHRAEDIDGLLEPLRQGRADVVLGTRREADAVQTPAARLFRRLLAFCLTRLTGRPVTDPTCGFCALGPGAIRLLAEHHPAGYPEPELRLLLSRTVLTTVEVPVASRSRLSGNTSLTPPRLVVAAARVALAMCVEPLRRTVPELARD